MKSCVSRGAAALLIAMPFTLSAQEATPTDDELVQEMQAALPEGGAVLREVQGIRAACE